MYQFQLLYRHSAICAANKAAPTYGIALLASCFAAYFNAAFDIPLLKYPSMAKGTPPTPIAFIKHEATVSAPSANPPPVTASTLII